MELSRGWLSVTTHWLHTTMKWLQRFVNYMHPSRAMSVNNMSPPTHDVNNSLLPSVILSENDIVAAIKSFPAGSAGAHWIVYVRPQHLKDMTSSFTGWVGNQLITALTEFSNTCLNGRVPLCVTGILRCLIVFTGQEGRRH